MPNKTLVSYRSAVARRLRRGLNEADVTYPSMFGFNHKLARKTITKLFLRGSHVCCLIYAVTEITAGRTCLRLDSLSRRAALTSYYPQHYSEILPHYVRLNPPLEWHNWLSLFGNCVCFLEGSDQLMNRSSPGGQFPASMFRRIASPHSTCQNRTYPISYARALRRHITNTGIRH